MNHYEKAQARHHTYALFSRLFLQGMTSDLRPFTAQIPQLTAVTPNPFNPDAAAAVYQNIFGFNIFPHASIFLDDSGLLGGDVSAEVGGVYREAGFANSSAADHIGHELAFLAYLCQAEAEARQDGETAVLPRIRQITHNFLQNHLLPWLPPFVIALRRSGDAFYGQLGDLTLALTVDHANEFSEQAESKENKNVMPQAGDAPTDLLNNERTGLKEIAHFLITPPHSGVYLSRDTIARLARAHSLPRGFGSRQQILLNLLRTAVSYDLLTDVITLLGEETAVWQTEYQSQQTSMPALKPFLSPWVERAHATSQLLATMQAVVY